MSRDYHSNVNQKILRKFVDQNVIMQGTDIVEYCLRNCEMTEDSPFSYNDIENMYIKVCPECGNELDEIDEDEIEAEHKWVCEYCGESHETKEDALSCCYSDEELKEGLEESDMIREVWICPFCEEEYKAKEDAENCICHWREKIYKCPCCEEHVLESESNEEMNEALEWWFVVPGFAEQLKKHGEMVIRGWNNAWGRSTTGQAIYLDNVVGKIAEEMEILEGMENDWSKTAR